MSISIPIVSVEVLGPPEKVPARSGHGIEWRVPICYTLDNGNTLEHGDRYGTRRDALAKAGELRSNHYAQFNDAGDHIGFRQSFRIGS